MPYDSSLTVFSPEGHLIQVQYAHKAVARGTAAVGLVTEKGIVLAVERKQTARLQDPRTNQKLLDIDEHIYATYSGLTADARRLIAKLRYIAQEHRLVYDEAPSVAIITKEIANYMQTHTQSGGRRPFGVTLIIAGKDAKGYSLYSVDPSGVFTQWKGVSIGNQQTKIQEFIDKKYKDDLSIEDLAKLGKDAVGQIVEDLEDGIEVKIIHPDDIAVMRIGKMELLATGFFGILERAQAYTTSMQEHQKRAYQKWTATDEAKLYAVSKQTGCNWYLVRVQWFPQFTELQIRHKYYQLRQKRRERREQVQVPMDETEMLLDQLLTLFK